MIVDKDRVYIEIASFGALAKEYAAQAMISLVFDESTSSTSEKNQFNPRQKLFSVMGI